VSCPVAAESMGSQDEKKIEGAENELLKALIDGKV